MKKIMFTALLSSLVLGGLSLTTTNASAEEWTPRTIEQIKTAIGNKNEYTIQYGDFLYGISLATNISVNKLQTMNSIANADLIFAGNKMVFDGINDVVTVKDANGSVVEQTYIAPEDKVNPTQPVGNGSTNDNPVTENGSSDTNGEGTTNPETPTNPIEPVNPTDPEKPVGPFEGAQIPGVNNGIVGTWTDQDALMDAVEDYKLKNDLHGPEWDYAMTTNGYGWIAMWVNAPTNPTLPEGPYTGEVIPGVNNGDVGTWTDKNAMMAYIEANWDKVSGGRNDYAMTTNDFGWIALFY